MGQMKKVFMEQREQETTEDSAYYNDAVEYQQWLNEERPCGVFAFITDPSGELCVIQGSSIQRVYDIAAANHIPGDLSLVFPSKSLS